MANKKYDEEAKEYTPAQIKKLKAKAKEYYISKQGEVSVKVLSRIAKVPQGYIRQWMKEDNWDSAFKEDLEDKVILSDKTKEILKNSPSEFGLSEQEELFCYHYLKSFNATSSAIKAGYSSSFAHQGAHRLLKKDKIKDYITFIKGERNSELFIDSMRIIQEYIRIAFADITDFISFGPDGLILRNSRNVDGQLITKVKEGRDGVSIELADKMKALEKLEKYLGVMPEDWRKALEERKVDLMERKLDMVNQLGKDGKISVTIVDDI